MAISEEAPVVNVTTASVSGIVDERQIKELPLNGRSFDNLITLNPGTINYSALKSPNTSTSNGNTFSVAGRRTSENLFLLNGVEYMGSSQLAVTPGGASGVPAGNRCRPRIQRSHRHLFRRIRQARRSASQRRHAIRDESISRHNFRIFAQQRARFAGALRPGTVPPFRRNQFGAAAGGRSRKIACFCSATTKDSANRLT